MSAQDLTFAELLEATLAWVEGPSAELLRTHPVSASFMPVVVKQREILAAAPPDSPELRRVMELLGEADDDHDEFVRFLVQFLRAFRHDDDPKIVAAAAELLRLLFPDGAELVRKSFMEEAGRALAREKLATPEVRATLASFPLPNARTLETKFDTLQKLARQVGDLSAERDRLAGGVGPSATELLAAKRRLIATVEQVLESFAMLEDTLDGATRTAVDELEDKWSTYVTNATQRAASRREMRKKRQASAEPISKD
jgi:hypothetical protein